MTPEQYLSIIEANDYRKSQVHYKVKVYFVDGTEVEGENTARSRADDKEIEIYESPIASMTIYEGENGQTGLEDVEISHDQLLNSPIFGGKLPDGRAYNLLGIPVDENYKGVVIQNGKKILRK